MWPLWSGRKSGERTGLGLFLEYRWIMVVVGMFSHLNMCLSLFLVVRPWTIQKRDGLLFWCGRCINHQSTG
jgi:hypothetical protein